VATVTALAVVVTGAATAANADTRGTDEEPVRVTDAEAAAIAAELVRDRPRSLFASPDDEFTQLPVTTAQGWHYVPYERTYRGMPMIGGDFVVVVDPTGEVRTTSVALTHEVKEVAREPKLSLAKAQEIAGLGKSPEVEGELVVFALGDASALAWHVRGPASSAYVDALTGAVLDRLDSPTLDWDSPPPSTTCLAADVTGKGYYNGPNPLPLSVQFCHLEAYSSSTYFYVMVDPAYPGLGCGPHADGTIFSNDDGAWGDGTLSNLETQCVDAMFAAQTQLSMLNDWLGRNGLDNQGSALPIFVGAPINRIDTTGRIDVGHDPYYGRPLTTLDVIGLAMGRAIDRSTPGGLSRKGTQEFIADAFGIATELYANEPEPFDTPDWAIGEMTQDQLHNSIPDWIEALRRPEYPNWPYFDRCYSPEIESGGLHTPHMTSGIGDYWFFLLSNGTDYKYDDGLLALCNGGRSLDGIGMLNAFTILYHAMLMKTSDSSYPAYRLWTVTAASNLFHYQCAIINRVKAAWDAVNVPAQPGEPVCNPKMEPGNLPYPLTEIQPA
jgi:Zn-dependent metalloprotease